MISFRVYVEEDRGGPYYEVNIFPDRKKMWDFCRVTTKEIGGRVPRGYEALTQTWVGGGLSLGRVLFHKRELGAGIVAHEMTHAAMWWAKRRRLRPDRPRGEEHLAWAVGNLVSQFWKRFYEQERKPGVSLPK